MKQGLYVDYSSSFTTSFLIFPTSNLYYIYSACLFACFMLFAYNIYNPFSSPLPSTQTKSLKWNLRGSLNAVAGRSAIGKQISSRALRKKKKERKTAGRGKQWQVNTAETEKKHLHLSIYDFHPINSNLSVLLLCDKYSLFIFKEKFKFMPF